MADIIYCATIAENNFNQSMWYKGVAENKELVLKMLCRCSGIRDCEAVTGVSLATVLRLLKTTAQGTSIKSRQHGFGKVQIDE